MFTPDASGKRSSSRRAASARRSLGPGTPRQGTPARRSMTPRAGSVSVIGSDDLPLPSSARSTRTIQREDDQRILVRNEALTVDVWAELPVELQETIHHSDLYTSAFRSTVRQDLGYACIVGRESCWVWSISRRHSPATAFIFPCPPLSSTASTSASSFFTPTPYVALLPTAKGREPALLLVAPGGAIRLWQAVSMGLSGPQRFTNAHIALNPDEVIKDTALVSRSLLLLTTSTSRVFRLNVQSIGGQMVAKPSPIAIDLRASAGLLSRFLPTWGSSGVVSATDGAFALAIGETDDPRQSLAWVLEKDTLSSLMSAAQLLGQAGNLAATLLPHLVHVELASQIQLLSIAVASNDNSIILLASTTSVSASSTTSYYLIMLSSNVRELQQGQRLDIQVDFARKLGYSAPPDMRPLAMATVKLLAGGPLAAIAFVDVLVVTSISPRSSLDEMIPLKASASTGETRNRFFGIDELPSASPLTAGIDCIATSAASGLLRIHLTEAAKALQDPELAVVPAQTDEVEMMSVDRASSIGRLSTAADGGVRRQTTRLRQRLEQAVYFGEEKENPLAFDAAIDDAGGDVGKAALEVSNGVLTSSSDLAPHIVDMRNQLASREARLQTLMTILHQRGLNGKVPQSARRQLAYNAEKLAAASALWTAHNAHLASLQAGSPTLLSAAVEEYLEQAGKQDAEDPVRDFLREQVPSIDELVHLCAAIAKGNESSGPYVLVEAANSISTIYQAVHRFRDIEAKTNLYTLDSAQAGLIEPWTSRSVLVDDLLWLFDALRAAWSKVRNDADQRETSAALAEALDNLADFALECVRERIAYLTASRKDGAGLRTLKERFENVRPAVIRALVDIGRPQRAYELGEHFTDFRSLVELATDEQHGSDAQIQFFIEKYGEAFAFPLYHYYIEKGQSRIVFEQNEVYGNLVLAFLQQANAPKLAWLHDVALRRYSEAAGTLLHLGPKAKLVAEQRTMLSISKLAFLATVPTRRDLQSEETQKAQESFDDSLDFTYAQVELRKEIDAVLQQCSLPPAPSVDAQAKAATDAMASALDDRLAFSMMYQRFIRHVLRGIALTGEEMIDLYTLTNPDDEASKMIQALQIFVRQSTDLPRARAEMVLQSIWRRIYLATDWSAFRRSAAGVSDDDVAAVLKTTPLFCVLRWIAEPSRRSFYGPLVRPPADANFDTARATVEARFETSSGQEVDVLLQDYQHEGTLVADYIAEGRLEDWYGEASRLALEETEGVQMEA